MSRYAIVWFRQDLRVIDNPALTAAVESGADVIPLYIWSPEEEGDWAPGSASRYWLHHALLSLDRELQARGSRLVLRGGTCLETINSLIKQTGAEHVYWNRCYEPAAVKRDSRIIKALEKSGVSVETYTGQLLHDPQQIKNRQGKAFRVFTPFWKHYQTLDVTRPLKATIKKINSPGRWPKSSGINGLGLIPVINWYAGMDRFWDTGRRTAHEFLECFIRQGLPDYSENRDFPAIEGVSRLSPFLHFGQISPRQVWEAVVKREQKQGRLSPGTAATAWLRQLVWREFACHLLYHFPETTDQPLNIGFKNFPWKSDKRLRSCWQAGITGYPIVDAGMRQLWQTGWMHNRVRMIAGSFLVKDLLIHWRDGARWFWDTLVDADLANNTMGWQWVAGCGADAAPYFRIFNPVRQGERFDPEGQYVRRWLPELAGLDNKYIHRPWQAPKNLLKQAGVILGKNYPEPIVDHDMARKRALSCYQEMKKTIKK